VGDGRRATYKDAARNGAHITAEVAPFPFVA
jgi:hypothetical protein